MQEAFPNLEEDIVEFVEELTCFDEDEMADAMEKLTNYEKLSLRKHRVETIPASGSEREKECL